MRGLIVALSLIATPAYSQMMCAPRADLIAAMEGRYQEAPAVQGVGNGNGVIVEWWMNDETGSWTLVMTRPDGIMCVLMTGDNAEIVALPGDPA